MRNEVPNKQLQSFGFTVGGIFALIAFWPLVIRGEDPRGWAVAVAAFLLLPAVIFPRSLLWVHKGWMALGHILGWINTKMILGSIFYIIVTPIGLFRRWLGKDPMGRQLRPDLKSYRIIRNRRPPSHLTRQY